MDQLAYAKEYRVVTYDQETKMANLKIFYEKTKVIDQINDQNRKIYNKIQEVDNIQKEIKMLILLVCIV